MKLRRSTISMIILFGTTLHQYVHAATVTSYINTTPIALPKSRTIGIASPFPSEIGVSDFSETVTHVTVDLLNLTHTKPDDINVLLEGPRGQIVYLWADSGGDTPVADINVSIDDRAASPIPGAGPMSAGSFQVSQIGNIELPGASFGSDLSIFNGSDPNGVWSLWVMDDELEHSGVIAGGWRLNLSSAGSVVDAAELQAGDADQDFDFDQFDLVRVQQSAKYLSGESATWGEGDWDGAPGGTLGDPPMGNGKFDQFDIVAAQQAARYLTGSYSARKPTEALSERRISVMDDSMTGELAIGSPRKAELNSVNTVSTPTTFNEHEARELVRIFDRNAGGNIFNASLRDGFSASSLGSVAPASESMQFVLNDREIVGTLSSDEELRTLEFKYVPEPLPSMLAVTGMCTLALVFTRRGRRRGQGLIFAGR